MDPCAVAERLGRATGLTNRDREREILGRLLNVVRAGESRVLVIRGDPGGGKTVLVDYLTPPLIKRTTSPPPGPQPPHKDHPHT